MPKREIKTQLTETRDRDLPLVALVGRPNVGKSTLFNRLTFSRRAIIDSQPGMTRDRLYGTVRQQDHAFRIVDTGGIEEDPDLMARLIRSQTQSAIAEATLLVWIVDGREPLTAGDQRIAEALRTAGKPVVVFVNKMDVDRDSGLRDTDVFRFGFQQVCWGSAEHNRGMDTLLEALIEQLPATPANPQTPQPDLITLAVVGRPNVGKSSLINRILGEDRLVVSDIPGTTRDPVDSLLRFEKQNLCLLDTAGIRRRGRIQGSQESLSVMMATRHMERADVVLMVIDASDPSTSQDAAIAGLAHEAKRPLIIVVNKWDLIQDKTQNTPKQFEEAIRRRLKFLEGTPFVFVSAKTGQRITRPLKLALSVGLRARHRVSTGKLNRFVQAMNASTRMPTHRGKRLKIYYMAQVETRPPTFVATANTRGPLHFSQHRFLMNQIQDAFDLQGIPVEIVLKSKKTR